MGGCHCFSAMSLSSRFLDFLFFSVGILLCLAVHCLDYYGHTVAKEVPKGGCSIR